MTLLILMLIFSVSTLAVVVALAGYLRRQLAADRRIARERDEDAPPPAASEEN